MSVPSRMSLRSIPGVGVPGRIAYAVAWEGVITTHSNQVLEFIHEFQPDEALEALDLYLPVSSPSPSQCRNQYGPAPFPSWTSTVFRLERPSDPHRLEAAADWTWCSG